MPQPFLANASRFGAMPSPADSHWLSRRKIYKARRQPKDPSATGIPLNFKLKKAVSGTKIGYKCIIELMRRVTQVANIFSQTINSIIRYFLQFLYHTYTNWSGNLQKDIKS